MNSTKFRIYTYLQDLLLHGRKVYAISVNVLAPDPVYVYYISWDMNFCPVWISSGVTDRKWCARAQRHWHQWAQEGIALLLEPVKVADKIWMVLEVRKKYGKYSGPGMRKKYSHSTLENFIPTLQSALFHVLVHRTCWIYNLCGSIKIKFLVLIPMRINNLSVFRINVSNLIFIDPYRST